MAKPIKVRIDVTKIDKTALFRSDKTGAVYLDLVAFPIKGESRYGETHSVKQSFPKDDPRAKESPFLGNMIVPDDAPSDYSESVPPSNPDPHGRNRDGYRSTVQAATPAHLAGQGDDCPW
jgi:hypothetical protein